MIKQYLVMRLWDIFRKIRLWFYKKQIKCNSIDLQRTIICNNCLGGLLYHDYNMKFDSPFINLMIPTPQYVDLLRNIEKIETFELIDITPNGHRYPLGLLDSKYELHFMHYNSFKEAKDKWENRVKRIDFKKMYVILVETHSSQYQDLVNFDNLPLKNKIIVAHKLYPDIKSAISIKDYDGKNLNGEILWPMNRLGKTKYDQVDWLSFLNFR